MKMMDRYSKNPSIGKLYLTATHLIFVDPDINKETWVCGKFNETRKFFLRKPRYFRLC